MNSPPVRRGAQSRVSLTGCCRVGFLLLILAASAHAQTATPTATPSPTAINGCDIAVGTPAVDEVVFDLNIIVTEDAGTNHSPLDIVQCGNSMWMASEFGYRLQEIPLTPAPAVTPTPWALPNPSPGIFCMLRCAGGPNANLACSVDSDCPSSTCGASTAISGSQEKIACVNSKVYLSQGGGFLQCALTNASRLLEFNPSGSTWRGFNLPTNNKGLAGFHIAPLTNVVWGAEMLASKLVTFDLDDFSDEEANELYNYTGDLPKAASAFTEWAAGVWPGHVAVRTIGGTPTVFSTSYGGNNLGVKGYESLGLPTYSNGGILFDSRGPWQLLFDASSNLWFTMDRSNQLGKFEPTCAGYTPYNTGLTVNSEYVHSLAMDGSGVVWFTTYCNSATTDNCGRIGRIKVDGTVQVSNPFTDCNLRKGAAGIALNGTHLWLAGFGHKAAYMLVPQ